MFIISLAVMAHTHELTLGMASQSRFAMLSCGRCELTWIASEVGWLITSLLIGVSSAYCLECITEHGSAIVNGTATLGLCVCLLSVCVTACDIHPIELIECEPELVSGYFVDAGGVMFMTIYMSSAGVLVVYLYYAVTII
jgi:NADH:ubiquinone oxidoreductase subunit H